jgi:hypothetical protein
MNSENQQIPMNERFAFDDICVFGYFVSAFFVFLCNIPISILFAHPPGRRPRKIICGANEFSWPLARGVGI